MHNAERYDLVRPAIIARDVMLSVMLATVEEHAAREYVQ